MPSGADVTGRRDELAALREAVQGPWRLVTLTGPGGIGKTWLALRAVDGSGRTFPDGTCVVDVSGLPEAALLPAAVAGSVGSVIGVRDLDVSALVSLLGDRRLLLVLDGCEHALQDCAHLVVAVLRGCARVHVLATSRQPLGLTGERVVLVPPLVVPDDPTAVDPPAALTHDAVALFVERATAALPGFRLTPDNVRAVSTLCARLDGNPLAIELAAARAGLLAPQAVLERLDDRYRLLRRRDPGAPSHLASLRASVDGSWDLCTPAERALWARLSVFPADFELDAVEAVCSGDGIEQVQVLDLVDALLEKSVLARQAEPASVRYRMAETLRLYGAEQLGSDGHGRWSQRHAEWVEQLVVTAGRDWFGPRQTELARRLQREHPSVVAALEAATGDPARVAQALRMLAALAPWSVIAGRTGDVRQWFTLALRHGSGPGEQRIAALATAAQLAAYDGDLEEVEVLLHRTTELPDAREPGTLAAVSRARGCSALTRGDLTAAQAALQDAVDLAGRAGDEAASAVGWLLLGVTRRRAGLLDEADRALRRCTTIAGRAGDRQVRATAFTVQSLCALDRGHVTSAVRLAHEGLQAKVEIGDRAGVAAVAEVLAWSALAQGDPVRTAVLVGAAEGRWRGSASSPAVHGLVVGDRDQRLAEAREALGRREFDRLVGRGAALSWEAVVSYASEGLLPQQRASSTRGPLTSRELAVAELVARGMTNPEIAAALVISVRTVQGHVEHILRKLGVGSRAQVAVWVARRGDEAPP